MFWKRVEVREMERALVFSRGRLIKVLEPGEHRLWAFGRALEVEVHATLDAILTSKTTPMLVRSNAPLVDELFVRAVAGEGRVIVVLADGLLIRVLPPGEAMLFWKAPRVIIVQEFDVADSALVPAALLPALSRVGMLAGKVQLVQVPEWAVGLVFVNGKLAMQVGPGLHGFWTVLGPVRVELADSRWQTLEVNGQEILTKDKVTLRVNIVAEFRVLDPVLAASKVANAGQMLHRQLQLAVRRTLGTRTLDELLQEKVDIDPSAARAIKTEMAEAGVETGSMALKDVILPGEIREILNQVVAAEKQAQANLIRRREETAATRSLLNTARLMDESPTLIRLKELETLEKLTEKVGSVTVTGGFDGMLEKLLARSGK